MALFSRVKNWVSGEILYANDLNIEFNNLLAGFTPNKIESASADVTAMRASTDPGESGTESLAADLLGELQRLRFAITEAKGKTYWYETPSVSLESVKTAVLNTQVDNSTIEFASSQLRVKDLGITAAKIANNTITGGKIANATITGSNMVSGTVTSTQLGSGSVTSVKISDGSVGVTKQTLNPMVATSSSGSFTCTTSYSTITNMSCNFTRSSVTTNIKLHMYFTQATMPWDLFASNESYIFAPSGSYLVVGFFLDSESSPFHEITFVAANKLTANQYWPISALDCIVECQGVATLGSLHTINVKAYTTPGTGGPNFKNMIFNLREIA